MRFTKSDGSFMVKTLRNVVLILLLIVFVSIVYNFRNRESDTVSALIAEASTSREYKGVFIRDEDPVTYSGNGVLKYSVPDGGRLRSGSIIAQAYPNDEQITISKEIDSLTKQLSILKKIQNKGTLESAQPASLSETIEENYRNLIYCRDMKDYTTLQSTMDTLLVQMSTYQILTSEVENFDQQIIDINTRLSQLQASLVTPTETITSDRSAYFVSYIDGYEDKLSSENLDSITAAMINEITDQKSDDPKVVGKLVSGYNWYLAVAADNTRKIYSIGETLKLRFENSAEKYDAEIIDIRDGGDPIQSVMILSCEQFNYELVQHRAENVELIKGEYRGLKVPREAIRFLDVEETGTDGDGSDTVTTTNYKGVYIRKGEQVDFKKIDVIYEGSDYVLSTVHYDDPEYLSLYDDIMIEGAE